MGSEGCLRRCYEDRVKKFNDWIDREWGRESSLG